MTSDASSAPPVPEGPPEHPAIRGLRAVDNVVATIESWSLMLALFALMGVAIYKAMSHAVWPIELVCYLVFFIGLVGGALATHERRLFNIDFVSHFMPRSMKLVSRLLGGLFLLVVSVFFIVGSIKFRGNVPNETGELIRPATGALLMPMAGGLISLHVVLGLIFDVYVLVTGRPVEDKGPVA